MNIRKIIKEEFHKLVQEAQKDYSKIEKKLEELRKKLLKESEADRHRTFTEPKRFAKRVQLSTVAEIIDVPVNDLMLYFLNHVKLNNERALVEYHLGNVYFYEELQDK